MNTYEGSAAVQLVIQHVRSEIERGGLRSGDALPPERDLAARLGVSRPSLRAGLRSLAAMGVVQTRRGAGSFIAAGPPALGTGALTFLAALHGFTLDQMFEARLVLEVAVAGMAAERATPEELVAIGEEVTGMFASLDDPQAFLAHDAAFHRAVAASSGNPILSSVVEMVSELFREQRKATIDDARDLKEAAEEHRVVFQALRAHDRDRARRAMSDHLQRAVQTQTAERGAMAAGPAGRTAHGPVRPGPA